MSLSTGTRLGPYEILSALGAGGMGEVYKARDTRLDRTVAIKVLPSHLSSNPELKQRMEREARAISALQHPNICTLHDIGSQDGTEFLVMECLEGETLADRLRKGPLPAEQVIAIGIQVAAALEKAHAQGIVHRDLKPSNVMLTKSGAKLMDFGLAKAAGVGMAAGSGSAPLLSAAMTASGPSPMASPITTAGSIVGTIQYMSPEQIEGKEADARSDIFAFGAVLYEMATAQRAFAGKSQISVASAILEKEPDPISRTQPATPVALDRIVATCLAKNPEDRFQCAHDLGLQLKWIAEPAEMQQATRPAGRMAAVWQLVSVVALLLLIAAAVALFWRKTPESISLEADISPPETTSFTLSNDDAAGPVVLSPDGREIAFVAQDSKGQEQIYVRALDGSEAKAVPGTEHAFYPFWSPDGEALGFFSGGEMRTVPVGGGPVLDIAPVQRARGGSWGAQGILFTPDVTEAIYLVATSAGAQPVQVTKVAASQTTNRWPYLLPDGKHFLYLASNHSNPVASGENGIYFASLDGKENRFIVAAESNMAYARGHLLWVQDGSLLAQPFDPSSGKLSGAAIALANGVGYNPSTWRGAFDVNDNGVLIYQPGFGNRSGQLELYGQDGKFTALPDSSEFVDMRLSPDGRRAVALTRNGHNLWILDLAQGTRVRFTFEAEFDGLAWSPDSKYIYYSNLDKSNHIYRKAVDGSGTQTSVFESSTPVHVIEASPDGKNLLIEQRHDKVATTTWVLPLTAGAQPRPLTNEPVGTHFARFSPDGNWVVYATTESGNYQLYATSLSQGGKEQLTNDGGIYSRWSGDGKTIYYSTSDGATFAMPVGVHGNAIETGKPRPLFTTARLVSGSFFSSAWDATSDGRHFLVNVTNERADQSKAIIVTNWPAKLKK